MVQPRSQKGAPQNSSQYWMQAPLSSLWACMELLKRIISQSDISERWRCPGGPLSLAPLPDAPACLQWGKKQSWLNPPRCLGKQRQSRIWRFLCRMTVTNPLKHKLLPTYLPPCPNSGCGMHIAVKKFLCKSFAIPSFQKNWAGASNWVFSGASG